MAGTSGIRIALNAGPLVDGELSKMKGFRKNEDCPPSQELLDFQNGDLEPHEMSRISIHLSGCEFCDSEVEFYSHYPQDDTAEPADSVRIPAPLFQLAEALLKNHHSEPASLNSLLSAARSGTADRVDLV